MQEILARANRTTPPQVFPTGAIALDVIISAYTLEHFSL
jgi:hypothetical protein